MDHFIEKFNDLMSNRAVSIVVMLGAAVGAICGIAGGFYVTYRIVTLLGAS